MLPKILQKVVVIEKKCKEMLHQVKYSLTNLVCTKNYSEIAGMSLKHIHQIGHSRVLHIQNIVLCKDRDKSKACVGDSLK